MSHHYASLKSRSPTATDIVASPFLDPIGADRIAWSRMAGRPPSKFRGSPLSRISNNVQRLREDQLLTKAELARKAGVSALTVSRIESGQECRMDTQRKIILALGLTPSDRRKVFGKSQGGRA
jgi:DNA-binding XRE family transcriptional regulator